MGWSDCLASESVQSTALSLQSIDHVHGGNSLPLGVFGVGDSVPDNVLEEHLEHSTGLLIDQARDTLDSTTTSQSPDGGLGDTLDVVSQHLTMTLGASLSESLASFASSSHVENFSETDAALVRDRDIYTTAATLLLVVSDFNQPIGEERRGESRDWVEGGDEGQAGMCVWPHCV